MKTVSISTGIAVAAIALALAAPAAGQTNLTVSSWAPPTHPINSVFWPAWGKCVTDASKGSLTSEIRYNLAPPPRQFDIVARGVADLSWIFHGYNSSRFHATQAVEIPGLGATARGASIAYWRVHEKYLERAQEHRGVELIGLQSHTDAVLMTRRPIQKLADLQGMKIRTPSLIAEKIVQGFGGAPVQAPAPKVYEYLSTGIADGVLMPVEAQASFRLAEVVSNIIVMPGGFYYGSFGFVMNPRRFLSLSAAEQQAIRDCSGIRIAEMADHWDNADKAGIAAAKKAGNPLRTANKAMQAEFAPIAKEIEDWWVAEAEKRGIQGRAALDEMRSIARSLN